MYTHLNRLFMTAKGAKDTLSLTDDDDDDDDD
jgi:hypothetical protein